MRLGNKTVRERLISVDEFERTNEHFHKSFTIYYRDDDGMRMRKEYRDKYNVKRLLDSEGTHDCKIVLLEVVEDEQ